MNIVILVLKKISLVFAVQIFCNIILVMKMPIRIMRKLALKNVISITI